jgi:hypothetical protein
MSATHVQSTTVIVRHSRLKNGVASLAYDRTIQYAVPHRSRANACVDWMPAFAGMTTEIKEASS